jgi:hypothetical protein
MNSLVSLVDSESLDVKVGLREYWCDSRGSILMMSITFHNLIQMKEMCKYA